MGLWTPPLLESIGWITYLLYAAMCIATFVIGNVILNSNDISSWTTNLIMVYVVYFTFLETKGKTLEEIENLFGDNNQNARQRIHSDIGSNNKPPST